MAADRPAIARPSPACVRSRIANGSAVLSGVDGRSASARRLRDLIADLALDLAGGDELTEHERLAVRGAAMAVLHVEMLSADLVNGRPVDAEQLTRASNTSRRELEALQARRRPARSAFDRLAERAATAVGGAR